MTSEYKNARANLTKFVESKAVQTAREVGFGWTARPDAPGTYKDLTSSYDESKKTGRNMPVSSLYCDTVVYQSVGANHAMRFWHDVLHVETGLNFDLDDELELGLHHLSVAAKDGIRRGSLEWQILRIDLLGQNYLLGIAGRFPLNQWKFVRDCLEHGLDQGVLIEARRRDP